MATHATGTRVVTTTVRVVGNSRVTPAEATHGTWRTPAAAAPAPRKTIGAPAPWRAGRGLEDVGVVLCPPAATDPEPLESGGADRPARGIAGRVAEHGAGVGAPRLMLPPPPHDLLDVRRAGCRRVGRRAELGRGDDVGRGQRAGAVAELEPGNVPRGRGVRAAPQVPDPRGA